jgi:hypothetical protein
VTPLGPNYLPSYAAGVRDSYTAGTGLQCKISFRYGKVTLLGPKNLPGIHLVQIYSVQSLLGMERCLPCDPKIYLVYSWNSFSVYNLFFRYEEVTSLGHNSPLGILVHLVQFYSVQSLLGMER